MMQTLVEPLENTKLYFERVKTGLNRKPSTIFSCTCVIRVID